MLPLQDLEMNGAVLVDTFRHIVLLNGRETRFLVHDASLVTHSISLIGKGELSLHSQATEACLTCYYVCVVAKHTLPYNQRQLACREKVG